MSFPPQPQPDPLEAAINEFNHASPSTRERASALLGDIAAIVGPQPPSKLPPHVAVGVIGGEYYLEVVDPDPLALEICSRVLYLQHYPCRLAYPGEIVSGQTASNTERTLYIQPPPDLTSQLAHWYEARTTHRKRPRFRFFWRRRH